MKLESRLNLLNWTETKPVHSIAQATAEYSIEERLMEFYIQIILSSIQNITRKISISQHRNSRDTAFSKVRIIK